MIRKNSILKYLFFSANLSLIFVITSPIIFGNSINYEQEKTIRQELSAPYVFADFTWSPRYPDVEESITFISTSSHDGTVIDADWSFGDGSMGHGSIVSHTYNKKGTYIVHLQVTTYYYDPVEHDVEHGYDSASHSVEIGYPYPKFNWSPKEPNVGENVTFDASESWSPKGDIVEYNWSYTDSNEPNKIIEMGHGKSLNYRWNKQGNYNVTLNLTDDENNMNEITKTVVVSILRIENVTGGFGHLVFQIRNRGNVSAENIIWNVRIYKRHFRILRGISRTGTINNLKSGETTSVDIDRYGVRFGRIVVLITVETDGVKITEHAHGFMFGRHLRIPN